MTVSERVAYLRGLAEGLELDLSTKEGKLISAIIDTLDDIAMEIEDISDGLDAIVEEIDAVSEDLSDVEDFIFGDDDEDDEDEDQDACGCGACGTEYAYSVICPTCRDEIVIEESDITMGEIACPGCGEKLELELGDEIDLEEDDD